MTNEEKQLLIKDLCARLPYGVILSVDNGKYREDKKIWPGLFNSNDLWDAKPYLRPMSSMTEEELFNYKHLDLLNYSNGGFEMPNFHTIDWLNAHHFDYRGLIEKGLALDASLRSE